MPQIIVDCEEREYFDKDYFSWDLTDVKLFSNYQLDGHLIEEDLINEFVRNEFSKLIDSFDTRNIGMPFSLKNKMTNLGKGQRGKVIERGYNMNDLYQNHTINFL